MGKKDKKAARADSKPVSKTESQSLPQPKPESNAAESSAAAKPKTRDFSAATMAEFEALVKRYPERRAALLPTLRLIERDFHVIDDAGMELAARLIGVSPAYVLGVVTFYTHYRREGDGKHVVEICRTLPCALRGSDKLAEYACNKLGISMGETTKDGKITLKSVECIAACGYAPALQCDGTYYENLTPASFDKIISELV